MKTEVASDIDVYLDEYTREDIIARYISQTAGAGIAFVLTDVYAPLYLRAIRRLIAERVPDRGFRVLEYGCGGGMNLLKLVELIGAEHAHLERAFGADFSPPMVDAARQEATRHLPATLMAKLKYVVANNESLAADLERNAAEGSLHETFDLVVGVNTFRYSHRLHCQDKTARDLYDLLRPGGLSIMIDMNRNFPFFRSRVRNALKPKTTETYVPSLAEYARPFAEAGFVVEETRNFCWTPHSASGRLLTLCRAASPVLNACFRPFAMRSLVIARKPSR